MTSLNIEPDLSLFRLIKRQFKNHLLQKRNFRTIFSGKFGSGKTTFLKHFFEEEKEFLPITLHPVNYSIASNEDIFQYIKYDLLMEILIHIDISTLNGYDLNLPEKAYLYLTNDPTRFFNKLISFISPLAKTIEPSIEILEKLPSLLYNYKKAAEENYEEISKKYDEHRQAVEYIEQIKSKTASLYEDTILTKLLEKTIATLKHGNKKIIVIIEDLDRIDPEHIFRILNVFSAHFDSKKSNGENNFGIDILLAVCDEENIRNIFSNRYGSNVDYSGYIDKFYSSCIFNFNYAELAHEYIRKCISNVNIIMTDGQKVPDSVYNSVCSDGLLEYLLITLLDHKMINLRSINKILGETITFARIDLNFGKHPINMSNHLVVFELLIIAEVCGRVGALKTHMQNLKHIREPYEKKGLTFERLLAVLMANRRSFQPSDEVVLRINEITYKGTLAVNNDNQSYLKGIILTGNFGTAGIEFVTTDQLFTAIENVCSLIERFPKLRLYSYYNT